MGSMMLGWWLVACGPGGSDALDPTAQVDEEEEEVARFTGCESTMVRSDGASPYESYRYAYDELGWLSLQKTTTTSTARSIAGRPG